MKRNVSAKKNIYLCQVNNSYGGQFFLPYSVGLLQAYAQQDEVVCSEYDFKGFVFSRDHIAKTVDGMENPDVFAASCYIWNFEYTAALAKAVKEANPHCLVVLGGPHVPVRSEGFFKQYPWADLLIHYEGEQTFREVLLERLRDPRDYGPLPYSDVPGLSVHLKASGEALKTKPRDRINDLDSIPSPYLTGVFGGLMKLPVRGWHPTQETHRGCPYACTFLRLGLQHFG